jgi:hypothetical protein
MKLDHHAGLIISAVRFLRIRPLRRSPDGKRRFFVPQLATLPKRFAQLPGDPVSFRMRRADDKRGRFFIRRV